MLFNLYIYYRSLSFILCLAGFAFFLLCFCYLMIDEWKIWNGAPFYYPGMYIYIYIYDYLIFNIYIHVYGNIVRLSLI